MRINKIYLDQEKVLCEMARNGFGMIKLAEASGITHKTLKKCLEEGGTAKTCGKIAEALGVDIADIKKDDAA